MQVASPLPFPEDLEIFSWLTYSVYDFNTLYMYVNHQSVWYPRRTNYLYLSSYDHANEHRIQIHSNYETRMSFRISDGALPSPGME